MSPPKVGKRKPSPWRVKALCKISSPCAEAARLISLSPKMKKRRPNQDVENAVLSNEVLVRLLIVESEHHKIIEKLESHGLELEPLHINLLDIVLDAMGVPKDNTAKEKSDDEYQLSDN